MEILLHPNDAFRLKEPNADPQHIADLLKVTAQFVTTSKTF